MILAQPERSVEVDEARVPGHMQRRRDRQRRAAHAADHDVEPLRLRCVQQRQRTGQATGLVELDVHYLVEPAQAGQVGGDVAGFIRAQQGGRVEARKLRVFAGRQRLLHQLHPGLGEHRLHRLQQRQRPALVGIDHQPR
ncbi:hypothetical protein BEN78_14945 [Xanthomonas citri pv. mangiferaeindicae]|nr:hypothetical protein BEN78_14945 [Xanthomonas citri pv. mangiferaeindicae]